ncbi:hypothetical protein CJU90_1852 [Yarrowia sp. C11]|nr:hypothetical protein CKK34_5880 [Yarrowia sp. E02]KAG5371790.1 hypothetical protein CJU90_1852 [Yarrowia sp. C11]
MIRTVARSVRVARQANRAYSTAPHPVAVPPAPTKIQPATTASAAAKTATVNTAANTVNNAANNAANAASNVSSAAKGAASGAQATAKAAQAGATIGSSAQKLKPRKKSSVRGTLLGFLLGTTLTGFGAYSYLVDQYRQANNVIIADVIALNGSIRNLEEQVKQLQLKKD